MAIKSKRFKNAGERRALKQKVRRSKEWAELRQIVFDRQEGKDYLTRKPLLKGWNVHHIYFKGYSDDYYDDLNPDRFVGMNKGTHNIYHEVERLHLKEYQDFINKIVDLNSKADNDPKDTE